MRNNIHLDLDKGKRSTSLLLLLLLKKKKQLFFFAKKLRFFVYFAKVGGMVLIGFCLTLEK